jgi:formate dehydrogenase subunit delta
MDAHRLVTMANQIASFFKPYAEEDAIAATADHIVQFWDPRMRTQMIAYLETSGDGLSPIALAAVKRLKKPASAA